MYADMVKNSRMLSGRAFGAVMNDINALAGIVQGGQALAYSLGNLDQLFRQTYSGYGYNAGTYYIQYRNWSQTSLDTTLGTLRAAGLQGHQLQSEQAVLNSLRSSLQGTEGRLEALQALGDISEQQVEQLMKLRELMMADMSSKQAYQAAIIQQQAASEAAAQRFFTYTPSQSDNRAYHAGWH
jgi:P-type conjugative transfer protein TrbJ